MTHDEAFEEIFFLSGPPTSSSPSPESALKRIHEIARDAICARYTGNDPTGEFPAVEANGVRLAEAFD